MVIEYLEGFVEAWSLRRPVPHDNCQGNVPSPQPNSRLECLGLIMVAVGRRAAEVQYRIETSGPSRHRTWTPMPKTAAVGRRSGIMKLIICDCPCTMQAWRKGVLASRRLRRAGAMSQEQLNHGRVAVADGRGQASIDGEGVCVREQDLGHFELVAIDGQFQQPGPVGQGTRYCAAC